MTQNDLDKLVKYVSITLSHAHSIPLDIYLNDVVNFCRLNLVKEPISKEELDELAWCNADLLEIGKPITINNIIQSYKAGYCKASVL